MTLATDATANLDALRALLAEQERLASDHGRAATHWAKLAAQSGTHLRDQAANWREKARATHRSRADAAEIRARALRAAILALGGDQ